MATVNKESLLPSVTIRPLSWSQIYPHPLWNSLPVSIRSAGTKSDFKQKLRHFYSARRFVSTISLFLDFFSIVFLQLLSYSQL